MIVYGQNDTIKATFVSNFHAMLKNKLYLSPADQILQDTAAGFHDRKYYTYFDWL